MTPIVLLLDFAVLFLSYNITYESTLQSCKNQVRNAAEMALQYLEYTELDKEETVNYLCSDYSVICGLFDLSYVYAEEMDVEKGTETFIAIGFGKDASQEAKDTRYPGVVVKGYINDEELEAYNGNKDGVFSLEKTRFGNSLICYIPSTQYYDYGKLKLVDRDKPLIVGAEMTLTSLTGYFNERFNLIIILTISLTLIIVASFALILYFRVTRPIRKISQRMIGFITDREEGVEKLEVKGNDEFAQMSRAFNTMTDEINRYLDDIEALNRDKHTQEAELNIARSIQKGLLRPDHCDDGRIDIDAYMLPAKDVGGDLYDYQLLDDGRIFVAVADVSGKGISAALFMARAISLLHQFMQNETSPAKILARFNDTMAEQNPGGLFITAFLAVWDPMTDTLTYSNAGHNFPYILSDSLTALDGAHGVAAGLFPGEDYEDASAPFGSGDTLFLYTDGVNEAKNSGGSFYSTERLEEKLAECSQSDPSAALSCILSDLNSFTHGAAQSDDVTMLTLHIRPGSDYIELKLTSELTQLTVIKEAVFSLDVPDEMKKTLLLAAEEIFVNICSYAYDAPDKAALRIAEENGGISLTFIDGGRPFDPTADLLDIDEYDHENAIGGLGRFITFSVAERYRYERRDGKNILYLFFSEVKPDDNNKNT